MRKPSAKVTRWSTALATPIAVVVAGLMVWQASYAAFSGQTRNSGNEWSTGSITLTDDDAGSARFSVTNMVPGDTQTKCITVTANATVAGEVRGYAVNPKIDNADLADSVKFTVESGKDGSFADCTGFVPEDVVIEAGTTLSELAESNSYEDSVGGWDVEPGTETRTYRITWSFDTSTLDQTKIDQMQGDRVGLDFQWELQTAKKTS